MKHFLWAAAAVGLSSCVAADLTNRTVFAELTYGGQPPTPAPQVGFQLYAELQADVAGPWREPQLVATCLESMTGAELERLGRATSGAKDVNAWAVALWTALEPTRVSPACAPAFVRDAAQLAWALGKSADTLYSYAALTWLDPARRGDTFTQGADALVRLSKVLALTPANQAAQNDLPVLAMSGGAANGAFTAGFLFELLSDRALAIDRLPEADRGELDRRSRFSSVVGTSVGALLAQLLELAMIENATGAGVPLNDEQRRFIDECRALPVSREAPHADLSGGKSDCFSAWPSQPFPAVPTLPRQPVTTCALKLMQRFFSDVDETDLMCAEPGSVLRSVGVLGPARTNFIRFDPMQRSPVDPVLSLFHAQMHDNAMVRAVMSTETTQNQLVGFDERVCSPSSPDDVACLGAGLMASLVLPVFARPVSHAFSGYEAKGECGVWVDGGLRSQLPALRALARSRPTPLLPAPSLRVLALDTGRLTPLPSPPPTVFVQPVLNSLEQYATQQDLTELAFAQRLAELRDDEVRALLDAMTKPDAMKRAARPSADDPRVDGVYVPADVPEWVVAGAGYSFDRYVMRGLFVWGQQVARLKLNGGLGAKLGWPADLDAEAKKVVAERAADAGFQAWLADYSKPVCPAFADWLNVQGNARIKNSVEFCVEPKDGPAYFSCPAGAWNPGGVK
ncbi:MAG: patatin-like phospholipase family protein [Myxococcaceae bacterium]